MTIRRVDHNFLDQRLKHLENTSHRGNEEGTSFQKPSNEEVDETVNPTTDMVQEESGVKFLKPSIRLTSRNDIPKSGLSLAKILNLRS